MDSLVQIVTLYEFVTTGSTTGLPTVFYFYDSNMKWTPCEAWLRHPQKMPTYLTFSLCKTFWPDTSKNKHNFTYSKNLSKVQWLKFISVTWLLRFSTWPVNIPLESYRSCYCLNISNCGRQVLLSMQFHWLCQISF